MATRIQIKRKTIRTNEIPKTVVKLQKQAHDYLANFLHNFNFKKNKFYIADNIEIAPTKDKIVSSFLGNPITEFGGMFWNGRRNADAYYYVWLKDKKLANINDSKSSNEEIMLRVCYYKPTKKNKYPMVDFGVQNFYSSFMDYKPLVEHNQVKRANGKVDKYFTAIYRFVDGANNFKKFLNLIVIGTRVEWVRKYKKRNANGFPI